MNRFMRAEAQQRRDAAERPDGLIARALQSPPYDREVKKLRRHLRWLSRSW